MIDILTSTLDNINVNKNTALLLLDLKKAFDTVNHDILLNKMNHYGIRGNANNLFASFSANRKQYVFLNHFLKFFNLRIWNEHGATELVF